MADSRNSHKQPSNLEKKVKYFSPLVITARGYQSDHEAETTPEDCHSDDEVINYSSSKYYNFKSFRNTNLSHHILHKAELSFCDFDNSNLNDASLNQAILICSSFYTNTAMSNQTDVHGSLFLLS